MCFAENFHFYVESRLLHQVSERYAGSSGHQVLVFKLKGEAHWVERQASQSSRKRNGLSSLARAHENSSPRCNRGLLFVMLFSSDVAGKGEHNDNEKDQPQSAARPVTPASAVRPSWDSSKEKKNQNYQ